MKGRLAVHDNRQIAPVAKMGTIRLFLVVVVSLNWELHQMDVYNAFLHCDLHAEVYMKLPRRYHGAPPGKICKLRKLLYGLKQTPRQWFPNLSKALKSYGFKQSTVDYSLFSYIEGHVALHVLVMSMI